MGEIALQSDCMLTGYYNRLDATAATLVDGWYLTGDYGYIADGEVYVSGRKKDMIIVGGKNVYPQDIELLAEEVPGVHPGRVVAFGLFDEETGTEDVVPIAEVAEVDEAAPERRQQIADAIRRHVTQNFAIAAAACARGGTALDFENFQRKGFARSQQGKIFTRIHRALKGAWYDRQKIGIV